MGELVNLQSWAIKNNRPHGKTPRFVTPAYSTSIDAKFPSQDVTAEHKRRGYRTRRAYFWEMSQTYGIEVDLIQLKGIALGADEDFNKLAHWLKINDTNRNR